MHPVGVHVPFAQLLRNCVLAVALATVTVRVNAADCDPALGAEAFTSKCSACHSLQAAQHMAGPSLHQLGGRRAGTVPGFNFSSAMMESGIVWSATSLDAFLVSPQTYVPGTVMPFGGTKNVAERAALVCYLVAG